MGELKMIQVKEALYSNSMMGREAIRIILGYSNQRLLKLKWIMNTIILWMLIWTTTNNRTTLKIYSKFTITAASKKIANTLQPPLNIK